MADENDADVERALAAFGGTTMKYLNFASPLLKRAARTPSPRQASSAAEPSYEPLFKRAPIAVPDTDPVAANPQSEPHPATTEPLAAMTNEVVAAVPDEPEPEPPAATASIGPTVAAEPMPAPSEPHLPEAAAVVVLVSDPAESAPLAADATDASGPSPAADPAPFTSLADHMSRVFGIVPKGEPANGAVRPNPAADQADPSAPDRRTIAEMFRILSGKSESLVHTVQVAQWRDADQSLFRRL